MFNEVWFSVYVILMVVFFVLSSGSISQSFTISKVGAIISVLFFSMIVSGVSYLLTVLIMQ